MLVVDYYSVQDVVLNPSICAIINDHCPLQHGGFHRCLATSPEVVELRCPVIFCKTVGIVLVSTNLKRTNRLFHLNASSLIE